MDKWARSPMAPPPHWRCQKQIPSFSSSLLDAIYRSIDESDGGPPDLAHPYSLTTKTNNPKDKRCTLTPPTPSHVSCRRDLAEDRGQRGVFSASSSSECSSFGGFSSSDADSIARPRPVLTRCDRVRSDPPPEKKRPSSIRSRILNLRKLGTPASPGARLSAFITAIFPGGAGNLKKPKFAGGEEQSETSFSRSQVIKTLETSSGVRQRVPARACEGKWSSGGGPVADNVPRVVVDELLRRFGLDEGEEDSDCESVSSSDLFELDSLSAIGRFKDELPVYGTTSLSSNRATARRFFV